MPGSVCGPQDRAACGEPAQLGGGPAELCPKAPLPSVGSPCLLPRGSGPLLSVRGGRCQELGCSSGGVRADGFGQVRLWASPTRAALGSNSGLLSPGHVFPEFKESDAMFAAERVSSLGAGGLGVRLL